MKFLKLLGLLIFVFSCRGESVDDLQKIDQILHIYIKNSAGTDLLNNKNTESFYSVELKDLAADRDRVSVSANSKTDGDGTKFLEYIAGANRILQPNSTDSHQIYKSDIAVQYKTSDSATVEEDRMEIFYDNTPQVFQINSVIYNNVKIFQKVEGQPNIITIVK